MYVGKNERAKGVWLVNQRCLYLSILNDSERWNCEEGSEEASTQGNACGALRATKGSAMCEDAGRVCGSKIHITWRTLHVCKALNTLALRLGMPAVPAVPKHNM